MIKTLKLKAHAKLNLYLDVKNKRADGFHNIETVMQSIDLCDILTVTADTDVESILPEITCGDPSIPLGEKNICFSAVREFLKYCGADGIGLKIDIEKNIPSGAGMGGGSADAAAVIAALNNIYGTGLDSEELCNIAANVGSDVPFCLTGRTQYGTGKGDILRQLKRLPDCVFVIGKGTASVSTAEAYRDIDSVPPLRLNNVPSVFCADNIADIVPYCGNIFEKTVKLPEVDNIKKIMTENGALCSLMTGSGSAVFGIFESLDRADVCAAALRSKKYFSAAANANHGTGVEIIA